MTDPRDPATKLEAIAFVAAVMNTPFALLSPDFQLAVDLSERFELTVGDILRYRKNKVCSR